MAETSSNLKFSPNSDDESVKSNTPLYKKSKKKRDYDEPDRGHLGKKGRKGSITSINSQTSEGTYYTTMKSMTTYTSQFNLSHGCRRYAGATPQTAPQQFRQTRQEEEKGKANQSKATTKGEA
jgi:hypothetical protein